MNLSMLKYFFELETDEQGNKLDPQNKVNVIVMGDIYYNFLSMTRFCLKRKDIA